MRFGSFRTKYFSWAVGTGGRTGVIAILILLAVALVLFSLMMSCAIYKKKVEYDSPWQEKLDISKLWIGMSWQVIEEKDMFPVAKRDSLTTPPLGRACYSDFKSEREEGATERDIFDHIKGVVTAVIGLFL